MSDEQQPIDSNPLSVDEAKALIDKWESHPGLIMAILDAARKLKDELVKLERDYDCVAAENQLLRDDNSILKDNVNAVLLTARNNAKKLIADNKVLQTELEQLRAVVAQNNASLSSIVMRWIQPSKN